MSDSYRGRQQYVIYCSQLRATPSADCNISHIAVGLSSYLILIGNVCLHDKGIYFVQDSLNRDGKFLSPENIQRKYNVQLNFLKYFQLIAAIPNYLKRKAQATTITNRNIFEERDTFYLSENQVISLLTKCRCKDCYKLLQDLKVRIEPIAVRRWCRRFPNFESTMGDKSVETLCHFRVLKANCLSNLYNTTPSPLLNVEFPVSRICLFLVQH